MPSSSPSRAATRPFKVLAHAASNRYRAAGISAWQFARGKLTGDPLYRAILERLQAREDTKPTCTVIDIGCGQGLMLALLAEAEVATSPARSENPREPANTRRLIGIETRPHIALLARSALGAFAEIRSADVRTEALPPADTIFVFDVLHMMPAADQENLVQVLARALRPGGELLIREADADAGWRFFCVVLGNRFKALVKRYSSRHFHFRSAKDWRSLLEANGLVTDVLPMRAGTPFGNVLFIATKV